MGCAARVASGLLGCLLWLVGGASPLRAAESVSTEEWAFRYTYTVGVLERTEALIELFVPEPRYCAYPKRPSKQDDYALLDAWAARLRQNDLDLVDLGRALTPGGRLRDPEEFEARTGVKPEPHVFTNLRRRVREALAKLPGKRAEVAAAEEVSCDPPKPPPPPPPPPPPDPTAGLTPPSYEPVTPPPFPDRLCSEAEKQALLRAIQRERQKAIDNSVKAAHFRHDVSTARLEGKGDAAALAKLHAEATADMKRWDAEWERLGELYRRALALPVVDCREPAAPAPEKAPAEPEFGLGGIGGIGGLGGGVFRQDLPEANGGLGVLAVGAAEKRFLELDSSLTGGSFEPWLFLPGAGPTVHGRDTDLSIHLLYGEAGGDASRTRDGDPAVVNGITWWKEQGGNSGVSSAGAALRGHADVELRDVELRIGIRDELDCWDGADGPPPRGLLGRPVTLVELGGGLGYGSQRSTSFVQMTHPNPVFSVFDVSSRNQVDLVEYQVFVRTGFFHLHPLAEGLTGTLGGYADLGYFDASARGTQRNRCNVQFAAVPGVNVCNPASVDFWLGTHPRDEGLHYGLGASARLDWQIPGLGGSSLGVQYKGAWSGVPRFKAPTNLTEDGAPALERSQEWRHEVSLELIVPF